MHLYSYRIQHIQGHLLSALALLCFIIVAGCGSNGGGGAGDVVYRIDWPTSRLVPINTQSVGIVLQDMGGHTVKQRVAGQTVDTIIVKRPTNGEPTSQVLSYQVPGGTYRVVANAYPNADGTGTPMASGVTQLVVADKQYNTVDLTMGTTIAKIEFTPAAPSVQQGQSINVGVAAKNAAGEVVLIDPTQLIWESTDGAALTIVSNGANATITGNVAGPHQIRVTENESARVGVATVTVTTGGGGGGGGSLLHPKAVVADSQGVKIIGVDEVPPSGPNGTATLGGLYNPLAVAMDAQGRIYISDYPRRILRVDDLSEANPVEYHPASPASALYVDSAGRIYFRDDNLFINRIDNMSGANLVQFGGFSSHLFNGPNGIVTDSQGRIYVSDGIRNKITRFDDMTGANPVSFGSPGSGVGQFDMGGLTGNTTGKLIAIDSQDRIYVADGAITGSSA